jgi:hypothetical protein
MLPPELPLAPPFVPPLHGAVPQGAASGAPLGAAPWCRPWRVGSARNIAVNRDKNSLSYVHHLSCTDFLFLFTN